ncbi:MAG: hypothetical protein LBI72_11490 [Flavobacteriaceae bacterium]|jgi:cytochrome oxidase Cu insertion factor (SCO1/SenC/PrrC family)|nr:hypothetical protein [Flavobacteriaceae bacterium]
MKRCFKLLVGVLAMGAIASCSSKDDSPSGGGSGQTQTIEVLEKEVEKKYLVENDSPTNEKLGLFLDSSVSYTYNDKGLMVNGRSLVDYTLGNDVEKQDKSFKIEYDNQGRIVRITGKDTYDVTDESDDVYTYDDKGRLLKIVNEKNTKEYSTFFYNDKNQVVKIESTNEDGRQEVFEGFVYNSTGVLTSIEDSYSTESFEYDTNPTPYDKLAFSTVLVEFTYKVGRLESVYRAKNNVTKFKITYKNTNSQPVVQEVKYEYDKVTGKPVKSVEISKNGTRLERTEKEFIYKTITIRK